MNKERRKRLSSAIDILNDALLILDDVKTEESAAYDNMPDGLRDSERGEEMSAKIDTMEEVYSQIEDAICSLEEVIE